MNDIIIMSERERTKIINRSKCVCWVDGQDVSVCKLGQQLLYFQHQSQKAVNKRLPDWSHKSEGDYQLRSDNEVQKS